jgi:glycosyltransferase involved in cell wall biosynthesis
MNPLVSIIIPAYNEEDFIGECLKSITGQDYRQLEITVVDDGSSDRTLEIAKNFKVKILTQNHKGPGSARNLAASEAKGKILVFLDADMTFDKNFVEDLIAPILKGDAIGTFSKNEMNKNSKNIWSACWNINRNLPPDRLIPPDYPSSSPVFRAILKAKFDSVGGFSTTGEYTDDWSLSRKLGTKSTLAKGALYYHVNPSTLGEVWRQARWIGKNEFISGSLPRKIRSLIFYSLPASLVIGIYKSEASGNFSFIIFKLIYDIAVWVSVVMSFWGEQKAK